MSSWCEGYVVRRRGSRPSSDWTVFDLDYYLRAERVTKDKINRAECIPHDLTCFFPYCERAVLVVHDQCTRVLVKRPSACEGSCQIIDIESVGNAAARQPKISRALLRLTRLMAEQEHARIRNPPREFYAQRWIKGIALFWRRHVLSP